jgi:hypothetical protein
VHSYCTNYRGRARRRHPPPPLGLPATPPPLFPARGPPQHDLDFDADSGPAIDQTPAYDPTEPEPVPDYDFDQSAGV